jgi:hypothetical protein
MSTHDCVLSVSFSLNYLVLSDLKYCRVVIAKVNKVVSTS